MTRFLLLLFCMLSSSRLALAQPVDSTTENEEQPLQNPEAKHVDAQSSASPAAGFEGPLEQEELLPPEDVSLAEEPLLQVYGFADFTYRRLSFKDNSLWNLSVQDNGSFLFGNLNIYLRSNISRRWTSLSEVRFTFLPNGAQSADSFADGDTTNSEYRDTVDPADVVRVGGIIIERAWLEYRWSEHLHFRMGRWLTPYGIWNIDHGSPTLLASRQPFIVGSDFMPEAQTGIQAWGEHHIEDYRLKYFATLSNGRGPTDETVDLDDNKAVGATLRLETPWLDEFTFSAASNYGKETFAHAEFRPGASLADSSGVTVIDSEADVLSLTADVRLRWRSILFFAEFVSEQVAYTERGRPIQPLSPGNLSPDTTALGGYGLLGYNFAWQDAIAWAAYESASAETIGTSIRSTSVGLVLRPLPQITLKASAYLLQFSSLEGRTSVLPKDDLRELDLQIAWVF